MMERTLVWAAPVLSMCALAATGCLQVQTGSCGELICPAGTVCAIEHNRCVAPEQVDACVGLADGDPCVYFAEEGECDLGVCFSFTCGNGHVEGPEVCDDGNTADRDGCSADCRSDETCGNGLIDGRVGEQCDDGNLASGDGCQANCSLPTCGDSIVDPGEVCDDGNFDAGDDCSSACLSDETCGNGIIDVAADEACDDGNTDAGDRCGPTCQIEVCGNDVLDPLEVCDDGNTESGDGCNASCRSTEICGNGFTDVDEQCDDGNQRSHDGCSSQCVIELPFFGEVTDDAPNRRKHRGVYDPVHDRLVFIGGEGPLGETSPDAIYVRGDLQWRGSGPPGRVGHAAAWDASGGRVVVFGGQAPQLARPMDPIPEISAPQNDVWVQTDDVFVPLEASDGPSARWYAAMAYHPDAGGIVVFGGESLAGAEADTWVLEGATWRRLDIPGPPARARHHMVYDSARRRILMTGGQDASGADLTDTWTFDGTSWTNASAPIAVPPGGLAYDAARDRVVAFGGLERNSRDRLSEFDGATWTASTGMPGARWGFAMAYDARAGEVVVHDGTFRPIGPGFDELWGYDGTSWRERDLEDRPSNRRSAPFAYDARLRRSVLFGGDLVAGMIDLHDLWAYDLSGFRPIDAMTPGPDTGTASGLVFDSVRGVYVAAVVAAGEFQTWELDGRRWLRKETSRAPSATSGFFGMAFDARRGVTVLFGGRAGPPVGETWEYDGGDWTPVMGPGPSARSTVGFTFDAERGVCVLYGGTSGRPPDVIEFADTWEFDGTWREVTPVDGVGPGGRFGDNLVFHASRRTVFLHAGEPGALNDTWEFDGVQWSRVRHPVNPGPRARPSVAFDQSRDALILTHGDPADDTWELRYVSDTPDELCRGDVDEDEDGLVDCADPDCDGRACGPRGELCGSGACACPFANETHCGDGHDDDCDGLRDCDDPDCAGATWCMAEANCGDGLDDDRDGQADCGDPGCDGVGFCERRETQCGDGEDNDGDGAADCEDGDCFLVSCAVLE